MTADFVVIGGGVIGLCVARTAKQRYPEARVVVLEKEASPGLHASGRNSGVLHAGFYYTRDSLKARFTREGNAALTRFCLERGLAIRRCGKLVVATREEEVEGLHELLRRAEANGVELHLITEREAREIEPRARTVRNALFSPTTSSVNPHEVMRALAEELRALGVEIRTGTAFLGRDADTIRTSSGSLSAGYVVNAAGLHADSIARCYGFSQHYRILPFKGLYLYSERDEGFRTHIYPVPNLANPFLGVHVTVTPDGKTKIGPTAIPAFWRENYGGLGGLDLAELAEIGARTLGLFRRNEFDFRRLAVTELAKYSRRRMARLASSLADGISAKHFRRWGPPGIRAQLFDTRTQRLEMDFRFEGDERSLHVLNAVSPAFTCSFPFADFVFDQVERLGAGRSVATSAGA